MVRVEEWSSVVRAEEWSSVVRAEEWSSMVRAEESGAALWSSAMAKEWSSVASAQTTVLATPPMGGVGGGGWGMGCKFKENSN